MKKTFWKYIQLKRKAPCEYFSRSFPREESLPNLFNNIEYTSKESGKEFPLIAPHCRKFNNISPFWGEFTKKNRRFLFLTIDVEGQFLI
jgi:hypothetical protein